MSKPTSDDFLKRFGELVRMKREERGLSQEKLAEKTGFHRNYIGLVERGERNISLNNVKRFADFFEVKVSELFGTMNE